jgi:hypothetical protein
MTNENKVITGAFPAKSEINPEERARRQMVEAQRLANLAPGEWRLWIDDSAKQVGLPRSELEKLVLNLIVEREKRAREAKAEARRVEDRAEKKREQQEREHKRAQQREQCRVEAEAKRTARDKGRAFAAIVETPSKSHEAQLIELAKRLDEDIATIRIEFAEFYGSRVHADSRPGWHHEPWPEPVATADLLSGVINKIRRYVVMHPHEAIAVGLWTLMAWLHDTTATHSAYLAVTSPVDDSGKSTLVNTIGLLTPRPYIVGETTGPSLYRIIDHDRPTLILDDADRLFLRKPDLAHIYNLGWTRGTKIPRMMGGRVHLFDPFCPKLIGLIGLDMPRPLAGRCMF